MHCLIKVVIKVKIIKLWCLSFFSAALHVTHPIVTRYEELLSRGEVLTGHQLEEMEACLSGLPVALTSSEEENQHDVLTMEERERLEDQLEVLTMRKNQLRYYIYFFTQVIT